MFSDQDSRGVALVTGAASGLGRTLSVRLARAGYTLWMTDVALDRLEEVHDVVRPLSPQSRAFSLDVSAPADWARAAVELESQDTPLEVLVNCAGLLAVGDFFATPPEQIKQVVQVNLLGTIYGCQALGQQLIASPRDAHIVNVASCAGFLTFPWSSSYNATKAGVLAYSETLANELADSSVSVTVACPGFFSSSLIEAAHCADAVTSKCMQRVFERSTLTVDQVADAIMTAIRRQKLYVLVPFKVRCWWWYKRFLPARLMRSIQRIATRLRSRWDVRVANGHED
ncbi:MAG: SDR family NAD(P)-dependent oxidoreductase [Planctomycetota bacterium]